MNNETKALCAIYFILVCKSLLSYRPAPPHCNKRSFERFKYCKPTLEPRQRRY